MKKYTFPTIYIIAVAIAITIFMLLGGELKIINNVVSNKKQIVKDEKMLGGYGISSRARTVQFLAGTYTSTNGSTGQNANTNQNFANFNFNLAENNVFIESAYVIFEGQVEAYAASVNASSSIAFDSCSGSCTASAWSGTSTIISNDTGIFSYGDSTRSASDHIRLLINVTNETDLSSYRGSGNNMNVQVGYRINKNLANNSIANANAKLVITYIYDITSPNVTNTVFYPLESSAVGDSGTRQLSTTTGCTYAADCPSFNYNMSIPEYSYSAGDATSSEWFETFADNFGNSTNDVLVTMKIGANATTSITRLEASLSPGGQGAMPTFYFNNVNGYTENSSQNIEYRAAATGANFYTIGGEVAETYIASSSAATKTRTVSFPIGVIANGTSAATSTGSDTIYFPENGRYATGTVIIKKAWLRIVNTKLYTTGGSSLSVVTKVGNNAQSDIYNYISSTSATLIVPKTSFNIIHVIPSSDYNELASANAIIGKSFQVSVLNSYGTTIGGVSAELMITYSYTDESKGYLTSVGLFAGGEIGNPTTTTTASTSPMVIPEINNTKTLLNASLIGDYMVSRSSGNLPLGTIRFDANMSASSPVCTNTFYSNPARVNDLVYFYKDVTANMAGAVDGQVFNTCYSNDAGATTVSKMNGQLLYTYMYIMPDITATQVIFNKDVIFKSNIIMK